MMNASSVTLGLTRIEPGNFLVRNALMEQQRLEENLEV
jgi:hypothetical protein